MTDNPKRGPASETASPTDTGDDGASLAPVDCGDFEAIGPYRILEKLGEGGMGTVYLAEQQEPVRREVALKVIKRGMDTEQVVARFNAERQALAIMTHPSIAKVIDAGATSGGRPYFAMEYVAGVPITNFCDQQQLSMDDRLALFARVCDAVQHAHQKGIIHRDLKPSNVLVSRLDGDSVPSVIDFGIAKAIGAAADDATGLTQHGAVLGTPLYMSPEQAGVSGLDVDTRADIYSLGMLLYELLVGVLPFDPGALGSADWDEKIRVLWRDDVARPSDRAAGLDDEADIIALRRGTDPTALHRRLRGDLDCIVLKAIEKDRARRYESAAELAADVERHLADEPVLASPPSTAYRAGKFVRRHRLGVAASLAVMVALVGGLTASSILYFRAETERAIANASVAFLTDDLLSQASAYGQGRDVTMRELLAGVSLDGKYPDQPLLEASLRATIGRLYRQLGLSAEALEHLRIAYELRLEHLGPDHLDTLGSMNGLARGLHAIGDDEEARELYEGVIARRTRILGPADPLTLSSQVDLAIALNALGERAAGRALYENVLATGEQAFGPDDPLVLVTTKNFAVQLIRNEEFDDAARIQEELLPRMSEVRGPLHPDTLELIHHIAMRMAEQGDHEGAAAIHVENLSARAAELGPEHPATLLTMDALSDARANLGDFEHALELRREVLAGRLAVLGALHADTARAYIKVVRTLPPAGRAGESLPETREMCGLLAVADESLDDVQRQVRGQVRAECL